MRAILGKGLAVGLLLIHGAPIWWLLGAGVTLLLLPNGDTWAYFCVYLVVAVMWWLVLPALPFIHRNETT